MVQTLASNDEERRVVAKVAIGKLPNAKAPRAVIEVPLGADLTAPPVLSIGEKAHYSGRFVICGVKFCRAELELPADSAGEIAKAKKASVDFILLGKKINVPLTTEGMARAFDRALGG